MCEGTVGVSPGAQTGPAPVGRVQRTSRIECALRETAATSEISVEIGDSCVYNDDPGRHAPPVPAQRASQVADGVSDGGAKVRMVHRVSQGQSDLEWMGMEGLPVDEVPQRRQFWGSSQMRVRQAVR